MTNTKFIDAIVKNNGYPRWDKSQLFENVTTASGRGESTSGATVLWIPFVRDSQNYVNATLMLKMEGTDTAFQFIQDWQYKNYGFDTTNANTWDARDICHIFLLLNKAVFNSTLFHIKDGRIYGDSVEEERSVRIVNAPTNTAGRYATQNRLESLPTTSQVCVLIEICPPPSQSRIASRTESSGNGCIAVNPCINIWVLPSGGGGGGTGGSGGSGGSGGGGGSSSGSGGWIPPPYICNAQQRVAYTESGTIDPCLGWSPLPSIFPPYIVNNLQRSCLKEALSKLASGQTNTFFRQIYNDFDTSTDIHLYLTEDTLTSAYGTAEVDTLNGNTYVTITLDVLDLPICSKEWIAYVLIHEVAHAAMFANSISWDHSNSQHIAMAGEFLTRMVNALRAAYPTLSEFDAYAICFTGFFNGVDGNPTPEDLAFSHIVALEINRKFNVSLDNVQLAAVGSQYTENGTAGTRGTCN